MTKLRVAFLLGKFGLGGSERVISTFMKYLDKNRFEPLLIVLSDSGDRRGFKDVSYKKTTREDLAKTVEENNIDVIVSIYTLSRKEIHAIQKTCKYAQIVNFSHLYDEHNDANLITTKTDYLKIKLLQNEPLKNDYVLYHPVDVKDWDEKINVKPYFTDERIIIGRLGRAQPSKWHYNLLGTLRELKRTKRLTKYRYVFVGMPALYRWYLKLNHPKEVRDGTIMLLPQLSNDTDIARFYKTIDVFFQTAWVGESFGFVIAESMIFKSAVLTDYKNFIGKRIHRYKYDAQIELVDENVSGLYAAHPSIICKRLENLTCEKAEKMGINGRTKIQSTYGADHVTEVLENILLKLFGKPHGTIEPTKHEIRSYEKIYRKKIVKAKKEEKKLPFRKRIGYLIRERCWRGIEYIYLVFRLVLQKGGIQIEK